MITLTVFLVGALSMAATCNTAPGEGRELDFSAEGLQEGRALWEQTEKKLNGNYTYIRVQGSVTGENYITLVRFEKGEPTARVYKRMKMSVRDGKAHVEIKESWLAEKGTKRLLAGEGGFPAMSMIELYQACARDIIGRDPEKHHVALAADSRGVLTKCYYSPKLCADDCGKSYDVTHFYDVAVSDEKLKEYVQSDRMKLEP